MYKFRLAKMYGISAGTLRNMLREAKIITGRRKLLSPMEIKKFMEIFGEPL